MQPNKSFIELRKRLGPSQAEFAAKTGISRSTIADIERGRIGVSKRVRKKIVEIFPSESGFFDTHNASLDNKRFQGTNSGLNQGSVRNSLIGVDWIRRIQNELKNEDPEAYKLLLNIFILSNFQWFIRDFEGEYLREYWKIQVPTARSDWEKGLKYNDYKTDFVDTLRKYEYLKPLLDKIGASIVQFYADFKPLDTKNIIENHFDTSENEN